MSHPPLLEGEIVDDHTSELQQRIAELEEENSQIRLQLKAVDALKKAMRILFGEFASDGPEKQDTGKWEFIGRKLGGKVPEFIQMLQAQPGMTATQLHKATRCSYPTATYTVRRMREAGIVEINGSAVYLKGQL